MLPFYFSFSASCFVPPRSRQYNYIISLSDINMSLMPSGVPQSIYYGYFVHKNPLPHCITSDIIVLTEKDIWTFVMKINDLNI